MSGQWSDDSLERQVANRSAGPCPKPFALPGNEGGRELWLERCVVLSAAGTVVKVSKLFWRLTGILAVAFGYFENLFLLQDPVRIARELSRIKGFNRLLDAVGQQEDLYEIFVEASEILLDRISEEIEKGNNDASFLEESFNVEYNSNAIITHFRVSPSSFLS